MDFWEEEGPGQWVSASYCVCRRIIAPRDLPEFLAGVLCPFAPLVSLSTCLHLPPIVVDLFGSIVCLFRLHWTGYCLRLGFGFRCRYLKGLIARRRLETSLISFYWLQIMSRGKATAMKSEKISISDYLSNNFISQECLVVNVFLVPWMRYSFSEISEIITF